MTPFTHQNLYMWCINDCKQTCSFVNFTYVNEWEKTISKSQWKSVKFIAFLIFELNYNQNADKQTKRDESSGYLCCAYPFYSWNGKSDILLRSCILGTP